MRSGTVRVLGDGITVDIPTFTSVSPANGKIPLAGTATLTASLDLPAGNPVPLTITDNAAPAWTFTSPATIMADTISVAIPITQAGAALTDMITVSDGTNMYTSNLAVGVHPVINEVDYDQTSNDNGEFVELYNPYATAIDLTGMAVVFATKTNNEYMRVALTGTLAANGYLVLGVGGTIALPQAIQNGSSTNPIGIAIIDTVAKTVLDSVSFTGASPGPAGAAHRLPVGDDVRRGHVEAACRQRGHDGEPDHRLARAHPERAGHGRHDRRLAVQVDRRLARRDQLTTLARLSFSRRSALAASDFPDGAAATCRNS